MVNITATQPDLSDIAPAKSPCESMEQILYNQFRLTRYFGSLDGVRALCILGVIFHHIPFSFGLPKIFHLGFLGVDVFFVMSGVLIETLILREKSRTGSFFLTNFYIRRSLRIFPIYYLLVFTLLIFLATTRPHTPMLKTYLSELPYYLTYTCNWMVILGVNMAIMWSLATEEQFYLIWPLIEKYCRPRLGFCLLLLALVFNQMINFGVFNGWIAYFYGSSPPNILQITFTPIILGVVLGRLLHTPRTFAFLTHLIGSKLAPLGWAGFLFSLCWFAPEDLSGWPRLLIQITMAMLIGSLIIREDHFAAPLVQLSPLRRFGVVSYGAYLYHMVAIHLVNVVFRRLGWSNSWMILGATLLVTYAMAEVSYRVLEIRMLRLKERWTRENVGVLGAFQRKFQQLPVNYR